MKSILCFLAILLFPLITSAETPPGHPPVDHKAMMDQIGQSGSDSDFNLQGKAVSVLPVSGYIYIEVAPAEGENVWMAVPEDVVVKEGDTVHYREGPVMKDFKSKSLNRTFPSVMFLSRVLITKDAK